MKLHEESGLYVTENGHVFRKNYIALVGCKRTPKKLPDCELNQTRTGRGLKYLSVKHTGKSWYVHRLVAECYIENPDNKPQVNHLDKDTVHNYYKNLEWCTNSENHLHRVLGKKRGVRRADTKEIKWQAGMNINNEFFHIGIYDNKNEAYEDFYNFHVLQLGVAPW